MLARTRYTDVRLRYVIVEHDATEATVTALLRADGAERQDSRQKLRDLSFGPTASPEQSSISWKRRGDAHTLAETCTRVASCFGDDAVFDLGHVFTHMGERLRARPSFWPGKFVVHVGGTPHCVVFDGAADDTTIWHAVRAEREDFYSNRFEPATE